MSSERGTGRTTKQIKEAPRNGIFVWCNGYYRHAESLANALGRSDLQVKPLSWLLSGRWQGIDPNRIVVDHYVTERSLSPREWDEVLRFLDYARACARRKADG